MLRIAVLLTLAVSVRGLTNAAGFKTIPENFPAGQGWASKTNDELKALGETNNLFTPWMSTDGSKYGTGEFEGVHIQLFENTPSNCPMWCDNPGGVQWELVDKTHEADIDRCMILAIDDFAMIDPNPTRYSAKPGYFCLNSDQQRSSCSPEVCDRIGMRRNSVQRMQVNCDHCPDVRVRYLCPASRPSSTYCPGGSSKRNTLRELVELDREMDVKARELDQLREKEIEAEKKETIPEQKTNEDNLKSLLRELIELKQEG